MRLTYIEGRVKREVDLELSHGEVTWPCIGTELLMVVLSYAAGRLNTMPYILTDRIVSMQVLHTKLTISWRIEPDEEHKSALNEAWKKWVGYSSAHEVRHITIKDEE